MSLMGEVHGISIIISVFNSETILPDLLAGLAETLPRVADVFEVILVNDNSRRIFSLNSDDQDAVIDVVRSFHPGTPERS